MTSPFTDKWENHLLAIARNSVNLPAAIFIAANLPTSYLAERTKILDDVFLIIYSAVLCGAYQTLPFHSCSIAKTSFLRLNAKIMNKF